MFVLIMFGLVVVFVLILVLFVVFVISIDLVFSCCLVGLQVIVVIQGIGVDCFNEIIVGFILDFSVFGLFDVQFEFIMLIWDYLVVLVDCQCVVDGCVLLQQYCDLFDCVLVQYGVDLVIIVVVWGVESDYGCVFGKCLLLQLLVMLLCVGCC